MGFLRRTPDSEAPAAPAARGRSVYEDRFAAREGEAGWVQIADTGLDGNLEFEPGWERGLRRWKPLGELLRERGGT